jgi:hypothetical protein
MNGTWPASDDEREDFADWQADVSSGDTVLGYRDWVSHRDEWEALDEAYRQDALMYDDEEYEIHPDWPIGYDTSGEG